MESSTEEYGPIYNRISWIPGKNRDVWVMQQSQGTGEADFTKWERLAIVIDKSRSPKTAEFMQLEPGPLAADAFDRHREFRVSCGICHTNGPRAIRPAENGLSKYPLSWKDRIKVQLWNLRIKTYGRVLTAADARIGDKPRRIPLSFAGEFASARLELKACARCHNDRWWGRGPLSRQNFPSIRFMLENGLMPPLGFSLSDRDRADIENFLGGDAGGTAKTM